MNYQGCLLAVKDATVSKKFYQNLLNQKIIMDLGVHVSFQGGLSLQQGYAELIGMPPDSVREQSHNFQVYFEVNNLDTVFNRLKEVPDLQWVHEIKEYPWGQRDLRIYDPDKHIIEIAEDMGVVIKRFFTQGMSAEQISERTMFPVEIVRQYIV